MRYLVVVLPLLVLAGCASVDPGRIVVETRLDPTTGAVIGCHLEAPGVVAHTLDVADCGKTVHVEANQHVTDTWSQLALAAIALLGSLGL